MADIAVWNELVFHDVKRLLELKYSGDASFSDTVFVVGYNVANVSPSQFRTEHPGKKIIVFNLEQFYPGSRWFNQNTIGWLKMADEVWDYDLDNIKFLMDSGFRGVLRYHPMEYRDELVIGTSETKPIDVLFYGAPTDRRLPIIQSYMSPLQYRYTCIMATGLSGEKLNGYLGSSKILVNIHADDRMTRQEQVRMFVPVSSGICVVSENSPRNTFGKSIVECSSRDMAGTIKLLLDRDEWSSVASTCASVYRDVCAHREPVTYRIKA